MLQEDNANYKLSYKIGEGYTDKGYKLGWIVGWIEENRHVYFFTTMLKSDKHDFDMTRTRLDVTKDILKDLGFLEGKK